MGIFSDLGDEVKKFADNPSEWLEDNRKQVSAHNRHIRIANKPGGKEAMEYYDNYGCWPPGFDPED